jgi:hypothetical protein
VSALTPDILSIKVNLHAQLTSGVSYDRHCDKAFGIAFFFKNLTSGIRVYRLRVAKHDCERA